MFSRLPLNYCYLFSFISDKQVYYKKQLNNKRYQDGKNDTYITMDMGVSVAMKICFGLDKVCFCEVILSS